MYLFDSILSVDHLPRHYQIRRNDKEKKIVKMFQEVLGVYTLHSQSLSDFGHSTDSALGPIYIQSMFESESKTLEYTKKGKEHFLLLANTNGGPTNGSFVWAVTTELPKKGRALGCFTKTLFQQQKWQCRASQLSLPLFANAPNLEFPPTRGWYTGNIFKGWQLELNIEVSPKGDKNTKKKTCLINSHFQLTVCGGSGSQASAQKKVSAS